MSDQTADPKLSGGEDDGIKPCSRGYRIAFVSVCILWLLIGGYIFQPENRPQRPEEAEVIRDERDGRELIPVDSPKNVAREPEPKLDEE